MYVAPATGDQPGFFPDDTVRRLHVHVTFAGMFRHTYLHVCLDATAALEIFTVSNPHNAALVLGFPMIHFPSPKRRETE